MLIIVVYVVGDRLPALGFLIGRQTGTTDLLEIRNLDGVRCVIEDGEVITAFVCGVAMA